MKRREFIILLGGATVFWPAAAPAQQATRVVRIGFLRAAAPNEKEFNAFRSGLRALGYVEGQNVIIEQRYASGVYDRVVELAADLARLNMDVIVVDGPAAAKPAKETVSNIPIVFTLSTDPVAEGLVASMAQPGGNLTGLTLSVGYELAAKRVELLKDIKPDLARLAILQNPDHPSARHFRGEAEKAAKGLGVTVRTFDVRNPDELPSAFAAMAEWRADGLTTLNDGMLYSQREKVVVQAQQNRLAAAYPETGFVQAGGLISYGPSFPDLFMRAASYVGKILKGEKPANLPIEQPNKFELIVNLKTAKALGLTIPPTLLTSADEVIE